MLHIAVDRRAIMTYYICIFYYRQHCAKHKLQVFNLLRGRFWGFSPRRGDTLHRWGWNLAWRKEGTKGPLLLAKFHPHWWNLAWRKKGTKGPLLLAKFHPHRCNDKGVGPKNWNFYSGLTKMWNINARRGISFARFSQNLQSLYPISGCIMC